MFARIAVSLACGVLVAGISYLSGSLAYRDNPVVLPREYSTARRDIDSIHVAAEEERQNTGKAPTNLGEIPNLGDLGLARLIGQQAMDPWGQPYAYRVDGQHIEVVCFGRDSKPGAGGLDSDMRSSDWPTDLPRPTLVEFIVHCDQAGLPELSAWSGGIVAALAFLTPLLKRNRDLRARLAPILLQLAILVASSLIIVSVLTMLHALFDSGH